MRDWLTAAELAAARLPGLPASKYGVQKLAAREGWADRPGLARRRAGAGGGTEYHLSLLPAAAQARLKASRAPASSRGTVGPAAADALTLWADWESAPEAARDEARARLAAVQEAEALEAAGMARGAAIAAAAARAGAAVRTVWGWRRAAGAVAAADRLAALMPRQALRPAAGAAEIGPEAWDALYADYMRGAAPAFAEAWRRTAELSRAHGWTLPDERTARRHFGRRVPRPLQVLAREGADALKRLYPAQERDRTTLAVLECVNADGHLWDVMVRWPDGEEGRPAMVAFQDVHSGMVLSWRIDRSEHKGAVLLALGDLVDEWGIPQSVNFDNGRAFASKWLTGGMPNRYRFKVRDDEPAGVCAQLGIEVHWTRPYSGQSKPIERAFRDFAGAIARHPAFEGAYLGNRPENKPFNHGSRAVPAEEFVEVVARGIAEHNARPGRRGQTAGGRSLSETFAASYEEAPIRRATAAQRRLWLLAAEALSGDRTDGAVRLMGNRYWAPFCPAETAGAKVIARFDPGALHGVLHLYRLDGRYLGEAPCVERTGFRDLEEGRLHARARAAWTRSMREQERAARTLSTVELARMHRELDPPEPPAAAARVLRPVFGAVGNAALAVAAQAAEPAEAGTGGGDDGHGREHWERLAEAGRLRLYRSDE